jgi:nicotinamide riboside kinase
MILFIEGPRHSGKTFLINRFLESCNNPNVEYYKFYFANHIKTLDLVGLDADPCLHYFSLGNIMTIMEMNQRPEYKDKIWIFDRAIVSAYTWAVLRKRLSPEKAEREFSTLLNTDLFSNCKTLVVTVAGQTADSNRDKDTWDGAHSTQEEQSLMSNFLDLCQSQLNNEDKNNQTRVMINGFNEKSVESFIAGCYALLELEPNK